MEKSAQKCKISVFKLWVLSDFTIVGSGFSSNFTIRQKTQGQFSCTLLMKDRKDSFNMEHRDEFCPTGFGNPKSYINISAMTLLNLPSILQEKSQEQDFRQQRGKQKGQGIVMSSPKEQLEALFG
ncbi:hypothetical protein FF2_024366 [Malus domestica]